MLVAATYDVLAGARDMRTAADRLQDATYVSSAPATSSRWSNRKSSTTSSWDFSTSSRVRVPACRGRT